MSYTVEVWDDGWSDLHTGRRYTLMAALEDFWREVDKRERPVRLMRGTVEVESCWPSVAA